MNQISKFLSYHTFEKFAVEVAKKAYLYVFYHNCAKIIFHKFLKIDIDGAI